MSDLNGQEKEKELQKFILSSLMEGQNSVRAFDTKAQIVGIGYIFAVNIVTNIGAHNPNTPEFTSLLVILAWVLVMLPIIMFSAVLYPSRKTAPKIHEQSSKKIKKLYNLSTDYHEDIDKYLENLEDCDINAELSYELMKVIALRDLKRIRFLRALFAAALSFALLFLVQLNFASGFVKLQ